jgi:hypothetical protein
MAIVWEWGFEIDLLVQNCERYVSSAWEQNITECAIALHGIERNEGVTYSITAYTRNRTDVADIASRLLNAVLGTKIRYCSVELSAEGFPKKTGASYKEEELPKRVELLLSEVSRRLLEKDENLKKRVEQTRKRLIVDWLLWLSCQARSSGIAYLVDCHDTFLDVILPFMKNLALKLGDVDGYTLYDKVEDPIAIDTEEDKEYLHVTAIEKSQLVK